MRADEGRCAREVDEVQLQRVPTERRVRRLPHLRADATLRCQLHGTDTAVLTQTLRITDEGRLRDLPGTRHSR